MIRLINTLKQNLYYRATVLFPGFYKKRFFTNLHKGLQNPNDVKLLPEKELLILSYLLPEKNVAVDVGANNGAYSYFFKEITKSERVLAFEPLPGLHKKLKVWFKNIELFNLALSDKAEKTKIRIPVINNRLYESRAKLDNLKEENESATMEIEIRTNTLDAIVVECKLQRLDVIKIDIEGHELKAINGALNTIQKFHPYLLVEVESRHHKGSVEQPVSAISSLGYKAYFFNFKSQKLEAFSNYDLKEMQNSRNQNTFNYINNFLFVPLGKEDEVLKVNERLVRFLASQ